MSPAKGLVRLELGKRLVLEVGLVLDSSQATKVFPEASAEVGEYSLDLTQVETGEASPVMDEDTAFEEVIAIETKNISVLGTADSGKKSQLAGTEDGGRSPNSALIRTG